MVGYLILCWDHNLGPIHHREWGLPRAVPSCRSICLEYCLQFIYPSPFLSLKLCLQDLIDYFVDSFDLPIGLWVIHDSETLSDPQRFAELDELFAGKLGPVVYDYLSRNSESVNNIIPCEVLYLWVRNLCKLLGFSQLDEVINSHYGILVPPLDCRKWTNQVRPPNGERPWTVHLLQVSRWSSPVDFLTSSATSYFMLGQ